MQSPFPPPQLQIRTPVAPSAIPSAGRNYLVYELRLQNFSDVEIELQQLDVVAENIDPLKSFAAFRSEALASLLRSTQSSRASVQTSAIGQKRTSVLVRERLERKRPATTDRDDPNRVSAIGCVKTHVPWLWARVAAVDVQDGAIVKGDNKMAR